MNALVDCLRARVRTAASDESGFTIVEGMIAAMLLIVGVLGVFQVFDASARNTYRAEESQVVVNRLQAEIEQIKQLPYEQIALTAAPGHVGNSNDPRWRVQGSNYAIAANGTQLEPMVVNNGSTVTGGVVNPGPTPFTTGDVSGKIYRFVVWRNDVSCGGYCPGSEDIKRIIVAATVDEAGISFERTFQEVQTEVSDPEVTPIDNPAPPTSEPTDGYSAEFWLTDTPCSLTARQAITADHQTHNTRGRCDDGAKTGSTRGAPDIMFTEAPALDPNYPATDQPLYDYASDSEPAANPSLDKGLLMPWSSVDSCVLDPVLGIVNVREAVEGLLGGLITIPGPLDGLLDLTQGDSNKHFRTHTWLSPEVTTSGGVLTGKGTLELWTKTVNGASHPGKVCASLFIRQEVQIPLLSILGIPIGSTPLEVDVPVVSTNNGLGLTYFDYSKNPWPSAWTEVQMPLNFIGVNVAGAPIPLVLTPGSQIGMTLMVKKTGTNPGQALEFMYDHPNFDSRLQLETNQIIGF